MYESLIEGTGEDTSIFLPIFSKVANELCQLKIEDVFVDVSTERGMMDFNLTLKDGWFVSVVPRGDNKVMYSLAKNHQTIDIGVVFLEDIVSVIKSRIVEA